MNGAAIVVYMGPVPHDSFFCPPMQALCDTLFICRPCYGDCIANVLHSFVIYLHAHPCTNIMTHLPITFGVFILCVNSSSTNQYMGFGLSRNPTATLMFGADPTITWVDEISGPQAVDYHLSAYTQVCSAGLLVVVRGQIKGTGSSRFISHDFRLSSIRSRIYACSIRSRIYACSIRGRTYALSVVEHMPFRGRTYALSAVEHNMLYPR